MKTVKVDHELDKLFNVTPGQTEVHVPGPADHAPGTELIVAPEAHDVSEYDTKDLEIEDQLTEIQQRAIEAYETMIVAAQTVTDKKYAPENAEVAANFLNIALNAVKEKNSTKDRKDKIAAKKAGTPNNATAPTSITNNIVTDRETAMRLLKEARNGSQE